RNHHAWVRDISSRERPEVRRICGMRGITAPLSSSAVQGRWSMADVEIVLHPIPTPESKPYIIVFGPDRHLWFCESGTSKIGRMDPGNGRFIEFDTPTPNSRPIGITPAADGALWFCENAGNRIGRITTSGAVTEFPVPTVGAGPDGIVAGPDGNVWF